MTDLARRGERSQVISVRPYSSVAAKRAVDRLRDANRKALNATTKRHVSVSFEEEVDMIALYAEVEESEAFGRSSRERASHCTEDIVATEGWKIAACPERHVDRAAAIVHRPTTVANTSPTGRGLSPRAVTSAAPGRRRGKLQLSRCSLHLESGTYYSKLASMSRGPVPRSMRFPPRPAGNEDAFPEGPGALRAERGRRGPA